MRKSFTARNERALNRLYIAWLATMLAFLVFLYFLSIGHEYQGKTMLELLSK